MDQLEEIPTPRHDFYQNETHVVLSLYLKGYGGTDVKDKVEVTFDPSTIKIILPALPPDERGKKLIFGPLYDVISPVQSSARVLSTKIEVKLAKASSSTWPIILRGADATPKPSQPIAGPSSQPFEASQPPTQAAGKPKSRRNWDNIADDILNEESSKDPNADGDASLQKFFSQLYADADEDTKRAMIKSYTESGGTSLSTNWGEIGQKKTEIRPPEGMESRKY